jgi:hypothetical protein
MTRWPFRLAALSRLHHHATRYFVAADAPSWYSGWPSSAVDFRCHLQSAHRCFVSPLIAAAWRRGASLPPPPLPVPSTALPHLPLPPYPHLAAFLNNPPTHLFPQLLLASLRRQPLSLRLQGRLSRSSRALRCRRDLQQSWWSAAWLLVLASLMMMMMTY